jgi:hypothetical protein
MLLFEMEREPDFAPFATPSEAAWRGQEASARVVGWRGGRVELCARLHSGQMNRTARLPKDQKRTENIGGLMFRGPTYRAKGRQALKKGQEFVRAFNALTRRNPWTSTQNVDVLRDSNRTSPNGSTGGAHQDAGGRHLVATGVRGEGDMEHVPTPCVVLHAPARGLPRADQPVTSEGGLIRFALGASNDRKASVK